jgi:acyl-CoA synthetase (AMP-forming)/AMP-acid ligase II
VTADPPTPWADGSRWPTSVVVVDAIPKNPVGKTDKAPLRAAHAAPPAPNTTPEANR